nr:MAG TPA: hypothetical protein [Caudoviricetes sp.]
MIYYTPFLLKVKGYFYCLQHFFPTFFTISACKFKFCCCISCCCKAIIS